MLILRTLLVCALLLPAAWAADKPAAKATPKVKAETATPSLVYGVTRAGEVAFRKKPKESAEIVGYFPGLQAVWIVRTQDDWGLINFNGVSGWIPRDGIITSFTINPTTKMPE